MYIITIQNGSQSTVIHEVGASRVKVEGASITEERNAIPSLEFTIYPENPGYYLIKPFSTLITVYNVLKKRYEFEGRVLQPSDNMDSQGIIGKSVVCENYMGYLQDSLQDYTAEQHYGTAGNLNGLQQFIKKLLDVHNSRVEAYKKIYLGEVTLQTFDTSSGVTKAISRASTFDNITDKLINSFGGEMTVRRASDGLLYLDYKENLGTTRATRIAIGRNMESASREIDPNAVITRLYPFGAKITVEEEDEDGNITERETEERIGISSVNNGLPYIDDEVAMEQYGIIEGYQEWDDVTQPQNLLNKAQDWLGNNNALPVTHSFTAIDLSLIGLDIDGFNLYDSYPCFNPLLGIDEPLEVVKRTIDISEPENSSIEMGDTSLVLSGGGLIDSGIRNEFEEFKDQIQSNVTNVNNSVKSTQASLKVFEDSIESTVQEVVQTTATEIVKEEVQNITVGARNLVLDSRKEESSTEYGFAESSLSMALIPGQTYVFSANGQVSDTAMQDGTSLIVRLSDGAQFMYGLEFDTVSAQTKRVRFTAPSGIDTATVTVKSYASPDGATSPVTVNWYQLEMGEIGTDWTPAPEDSEESIADVNSSLQDSIGSLGDEIAGVSSSVQDTESRIEEVYEIVQTNSTQITEMVQTAAGFEFNFQTIEESVSQINNQVTTEYEERLKYIKFIDGEIWLGKDPEPNEDDFKLVITNNRIKFLQNNIEVAYISNNKLYITNATITNRLDLGLFAWYPRPNGNLTLRYFGEGEE